jgi:hypothetical protein
MSYFLSLSPNANSKWGTGAVSIEAIYKQEKSHKSQKSLKVKAHTSIGQEATNLCAAEKLPRIRRHSMGVAATAAANFLTMSMSAVQMTINDEDWMMSFEER